MMKKYHHWLRYDRSDSESKSDDESYSDSESDDEGSVHKNKHIFTHFNERDMKHYLLLDNQSKIDLSCNADLLYNIRTTNVTLLVMKNEWGLETRKMGSLKNYEHVGYHEKALTKILPLQNLHRKGYGIKCDNEHQDTFLVMK